MTFDAVLRLRGWIVFVILFAACALCFVSILAFGSAVPVPSGWPGLGLAMTLLEILYFGWALAVGASVNSRLPEPLGRGHRLPAVGLAFATGYTFWFSTAVSSEPRSFGWFARALYLLSMAVNFYLLWYVSRALVAAEEQGKPPLHRVLGLFVTLWLTAILPIGAWWAQERARAVAGHSR